MSHIYVSLRISSNTMSSLIVTYQPPQDVVADDTLSATTCYRRFVANYTLGTTLDTISLNVG
jgi:hypothetical protein